MPRQCRLSMSFVTVPVSDEFGRLSVRRVGSGPFQTSLTVSERVVLVSDWIESVSGCFKVVSRWCQSGWGWRVASDEIASTVSVIVRVPLHDFLIDARDCLQWEFASSTPRVLHAGAKTQRWTSYSWRLAKIRIELGPEPEVLAMIKYKVDGERYCPLGQSLVYPVYKPACLQVFMSSRKQFSKPCLSSQIIGLKTLGGSSLVSLSCSSSDSSRSEFSFSRVFVALPIFSLNSSSH